MKFSSAGTSLTKTIKVKKGDYSIYIIESAATNKNYVRVTANNVHKGDYIRVTIEGKKYKLKIKKNSKRNNYKIKIKRPKKEYGSYSVAIYNRFNQRMAIEKDTVF